MWALNHATKSEKREQRPLGNNGDSQRRLLMPLPREKVTGSVSRRRCLPWGWAGRGRVFHFPPSSPLTKLSRNPGPRKPDYMTFFRQVKGERSERDRGPVSMTVEGRKKKRPKLRLFSCKASAGQAANRALLDPQYSVKSHHGADRQPPCGDEGL